MRRTRIRLRPNSKNYAFIQYLALKKGAKVEHKEHPQYGMKGARKIAAQHLKEDPKYYTKLKKCGL